MAELVGRLFDGVVDDLFDLVGHDPPSELWGSIDKGDRERIPHLQDLLHGRVVAQTLFIDVNILDFYLVTISLFEVGGQFGSSFGIIGSCTTTSCGCAVAGAASSSAEGHGALQYLYQDCVIVCHSVSS